MKGSVLMLTLSVLASLLAIALGPRLPRAQSSTDARRTLPQLHWAAPAALRRTRVALLVIAAGLLYLALAAPFGTH